MSTSPEITLLIQSIEEGYRVKAWHGTNLRGSIRGLTAQEAARRPSSGRHNIWEIAVHCAYWKYAVRRRILGEKRGFFPLKGSNWFIRPAGKGHENDWRRDVKLLDEMHALLVEALGGLKTQDLWEIPRGSKFDNRSMLAGIAAHDVYHAGQIQIIKRLIR